MEFPLELCLSLLGFGMWAAFSLMIPCWVWRVFKRQMSDHYLSDFE